MKRKITSILTLMFTVILAVTCLFACDKGGNDEQPAEGAIVASVTEATETLIVIKVDKAEDESTLLDVMNYLKGEDALTFETQNSTYGEFVLSINGKEQGNDLYWNSYTSDTDEDVANVSFGYEYNGQTLGYCNFGVSSMPVKAGCIYVWVLKGF